MRVARVAAQAKINVWLRVIGQRPDGFHNLDTLFHRIDLADEVTVRTRDDGRRSIDCVGPRLPATGLGPPEKNLAYRAAETYAAHTGWPRGFAIEVTKHIPVGGGLGGGSADAGAVLRALNAIAPRPIDANAAQTIAASLGSDVPFFVSESVMATATGRGDIIQPIPPSAVRRLPSADVLLVVPGFPIATADAYAWLRQSGLYDPATPDSAKKGAEVQWSGWEDLDQGNTFERVVEAVFPVLTEYREQLSAAGAAIARLSGSGSTVFGLFAKGAPSPEHLRLDARVIPTRTSREVVQVEVLE